MMMMMMMMMIVLKWYRYRTFKDKFIKIADRYRICCMAPEPFIAGQVKVLTLEVPETKLLWWHLQSKLDNIYIWWPSKRPDPSEFLLFWLLNTWHDSAFCLLVSFNLDNSLLYRGQQQSKCIRWKKQMLQQWAASRDGENTYILVSKDCKLRIQCNSINLSAPPPPKKKWLAAWMFHDCLNLDVPTHATHVASPCKDHVDLLLLTLLGNFAAFLAVGHKSYLFVTSS